MSNIANVQTSDGQLIAMNVEDAHVIDTSQLHALGVITGSGKASQVQIPEVIATAAGSAVDISSSGDADAATAGQDQGGRQTPVESAPEDQVTNPQEDEPMETAWSSRWRVLVRWQSRDFNAFQKLLCIIE